MNQLIGSASISAGGSMEKQLNNGKCNYLLFHMPATAGHPKMFVTVVFKDDDNHEIIVPRIAADRLKVISDHENGAAADDTGGYFGLNIGMLNLEDGQLEVRVENTDASVRSCAVYGAVVEESTDELLSYEETNDLNQNFNDVESIWVYHNAKTVTVVVKADEESFLTDTTGITAESAVLGSIEDSSVLTSMGLAYQNLDDIPDAVKIQVTGSDLSGVSLIVRRKVIMPERVSRHTNTALDRKIVKIKRLESKNPERARALRHSGKIVRSKVLTYTRSVREASARRRRGLKSSSS